MAAHEANPAPARVEGLVAAIAAASRREDCRPLVALMTRITECEPRMWGASIVGFGDHHYRYESGREGDTFILGFSPRKDALTLYLGPALDRFQQTLDRLGKYKSGKGCLYIRRLEDVDGSVLAALLKEAAANPAAPAG